MPGVLNADDEKEVKLSFAMPEGTVLKYETKWIREFNFGGMDITQNESYKVEMSLMKVTDEGAYRVSLDFIESSSSMIVDDDMQDWSPQMQLEGRSIIADVASNGEVVQVKPGGNIPGMRGVESLKEIAERGFMELPDTVKSVGDTWRVDIEEGTETKDGEEKEPNVKGWADVTFKKIEKKSGIPVACLEYKAEVDIKMEMMNGKGKQKGKYYIAIDGGYIVEMKAELEVKGKVPSPNGKEIDHAETNHFEMKLKK
jgi:hypothetical protein